MNPELHLEGVVSSALQDSFDHLEYSPGIAFDNAPCGLWLPSLWRFDWWLFSLKHGAVSSLPSSVFGLGFGVLEMLGEILD